MKAVDLACAPLLQCLRPVAQSGPEKGSQAWAGAGVFTDAVRADALKSVEQAIAAHTSKPVYISDVTMEKGVIKLQMLTRAASEAVKKEVAAFKNLTPAAREQRLREAIKKKAGQPGASKRLSLDPVEWKHTRLRKAFKSAAAFATFLGGLRQAVRSIEFYSQGMLAAIEEIESHGKLGVEGLYRISGRSTDIDAAVSAVLAGNVDALATAPDEHCVSNVLKKLVRDFPNGLIPSGLQPRLLAIDLQGVGRKRAIDAVMAELPQPNKALVDALLAHLKRVAAQSQSNLMPSANLAMIFGPNLFPDDMSFQAGAKVVEELLGD